MNFKNLKIKSLIIDLVICLLFPLVKAYTSDNNKLLIFSDTCFIIGLITLLFGVINSLVLHGDYDITSFIMHRTIAKDKQDYKAYKKDKEDKRKDSFNYPLICGIILLIISYLTALSV